jgi:hypothetical protein
MSDVTKLPGQKMRNQDALVGNSCGALSSTTILDPSLSNAGDEGLVSFLSLSVYSF